MLISKIINPIQKLFSSKYVSSLNQIHTINSCQLAQLNSSILYNRNCHLLTPKGFNTYKYFISTNKNLVSNHSNLSHNLTFKPSYLFCKSQTYVDHYHNTKKQIQQKKIKINQLQQKLQMLNQMSQMTTTDQILKLIYSLFGQIYQTKAYQQHKQILIDLRNILQKRIEESSVKWEQPRKLILQQRQKKILQFIQAIIEYEGKMAKFIKQRQNSKAQHLADVNQGLVLTHKLLIKNIQKEGGIQIWVQKGELFNQNQHEIQQSNSNKKGTKSKIDSLVTHGWKLKDRVIRKAIVTVK